MSQGKISPVLDAKQSRHSLRHYSAADIKTHTTKVPHALVAVVNRVAKSRGVKRHSTHACDLSGRQSDLVS